MSLRLGLVGENISYSLSPAIFKWGFRQTGVTGEYLLYDGAAAAAIRLISGDEWDGLSVTVPHKSLAFSLCTRTTARAQRTGAVNVLFRRHGELWGDNTDVLGLQYALTRARSPDLETSSALVIGSGGIARAAVAAISELFPSSANHIASRDPAAAEERCRPLRAVCPSLSVIGPEHASARLDEFDLVIQGTPVGDPFHSGLPLPGSLRFHANATVLDMIYAPRQTAFLHAATDAGLHPENGLVVLLAQAAAAFQLWTQVEFPLQRVLNELLPELQSS